MDENRNPDGTFKNGNKASVGRGRPKGRLSINDELRKILLKENDQGKRYIEVFAEMIFNEALKGNFRLAVEIWQQMDGKARQTIDVGGQDDNPIICLVSGKKQDHE